MIFDSQNWILASALSIVLIVIIVLLSKFYAKYTHSYINDIKDLAKHHDKYRLYFLIVGVFFPISEALMEVFKIRDDSELIAYLIVGAFCISTAIISNYVQVIKQNLHKIFIGFFIALTIFLFYDIVKNPTNAVTLSEFTMFAIFGYYSFYNVKHFYAYLVMIVAFLFCLLFLNLISPSFFIIYFNSCFISCVFNYGKHIIDLNIRENLFFAYNFVNKGTSLVVGVNEQGKIAFVSENITDILGFDKDKWIGKDWQDEIANATDNELREKFFLQKILVNNGTPKLIEWREEVPYKGLDIKIGRDITESQQAKNELRHTKELLEQTNRMARVGGWEFDLLTQKGYSSEIAKEIFEAPYDSQYDFQTAVNYFEEGEHRNKLLQALENCMKYGTSYDFEMPIITVKGKRRWIRAKGTAEFVNNVCKKIYGTVQDIDEQVKAKEALVNSEQKFRFISENTSDVIIVFNNLKITYISPSHEKLFGYPSAEAMNVTGETAFDLVHIDDRNRVKGIAKDATKKQLPSFTYSYRFLHKNGNYVWREDSVDMIFDDTGFPIKIIVLARDISERKAIEHANLLRQQKVLLQNNILIKLYKTPFGEHDFWCNDLKTISEAASEGIGAGRVGIYDYIDESIICRDLYIEEKNTHSSGDVLTAKDFPAYFEGINNGLAIVAHDAHTHPHTFEFSEIYLTPLGITSMLDISIRVAGELVGVICWEHTQEKRIWTDEDIAFARSIADIISLGIEADKRKKAEIELTHAKEMLEQTSQIARIGGWEFDFEEKKYSYSQLTTMIFEVVNASELSPEKILNYFVKGESRKTIIKAFEKCVKQGIPYDCELQIITEKGNKFWVRTIGNAEFVNNRSKRIYGIIADITERKEAEIALQQSFEDLQDTQQRLVYKSELLAATAKITENLLVSNNIEKSLRESFTLLGKSIDVDRVYYFANDMTTNLISQKVEWTREGIISQINNPATQNLTLEDIYFYANQMKDNKVFQGIKSKLTDAKLIDRWEKQQILSALLIPINIKGEFYGFIGFEDCTNEQIWTSDEQNILQSLASNISNAIERINNEQTIKESENNFRQLNETIEDVFLLYDVVQKKYIYISPSCKKVLFAEQAFFYSGQSYFKKYLVEDAQLINDDIKEQLRKNGVSEVEYSIKNEEGQIKWIQERTFAIYNDKGEFIRFSGICSDITARKLAQNEIKQLSLVAEKITNGVLMTDAAGYVLWANQAMLDMMEITADLLYGKRPRDLFNPGTLEFAEKGNIMDNCNYTLEVEVLTYKKNKKWIQINNTAIKDDAGNTIQQIEVIIDISERKQAELQLTDERRLLRAIIDNIPLNIYVKDLETKKIISNKADVKYSGFENETDVIGKTDFELFDQESAQKAYNDEINIIQSKIPLLSHELLHIQKNGDYKWLLVSKIPLKNEKQEVIGLVGISVDITDRKKSQQLLQESEEKFRFIAENTSDGIFVIEDTLITYISPAYEKILGYTFEESIKSSEGNLLDLVHPEDVSYFSECIKNAVNTKLTNFSCQYRSLHKDGHYIWREDTITVIYDGGKVYKFISVVRDITERKKAEIFLKESEQKLNNILNSLDEIVWSISLPEMKLLFVSNSFEKIFEDSIDTWFKDFEAWKATVHPDDLPIAEKLEQNVLKYGESHAIYRIINAKGKLIWIENKTKVIFNEDKLPVMVMGILSDITEKMLAQEALIKAHKEADAANKSKAELELRALQMQMNPHFVFNALNSIQSYVMSHDTLTANNYLSKFAHLIRLFLDSSRSKFISLGEEIKLLTLYIELEKLRFDEKFDFEIVIDTNVSKYFEIPTMILQPFIENAINHGLRYKKEKGLLSIKFYLESNYVICKIEDNGVGRKNVGQIQSKSNKGYQSQGLKITAERLLTYNRINEANIVFSINDKILNPKSPNDEVGTVIEIKFPESN